jgi:competence protein ComGC
MEKIQMTEEQAMCLYRMAGDGHVEFIKRLKQKGYIRKSALEIVEEEYLNHKSGKIDSRE